jgi:hypothetical protein
MIEYKDRIDTLTVGDLKNEVLKQNIIPEEGYLLSETILTNDDSVLIKDLYKPEVFEVVPVSMLEKDEIEILGNVINTVLPTVETIEKDKFNEALASTNLGLLRRLKEVRGVGEETTEPEGELSRISKSRPMYMKTSTKIVNLPSFVNQNINEFFKPILTFVQELGIKAQDREIKEFIQDQYDAGESALNIFANLLGATVEGPVTLEVDQLKSLETLIQGIKSSDGLSDKEFTELLDPIENIIEESISLNAPMAINTLFSKISESYAYLEQLRRSKLFDHEEKFNFNAYTVNKLEESGLPAENSSIGYTVFKSGELKNLTTELINPVAEMLISIAEPIITSNSKLDNELIEAAKIELEKLIPITDPYIANQIDALKDKLNNIINYGNVQRNTLLSKLREFQIKLYGEGTNSKTMFEAISDLNKQFSISISPSEFKPSTDSKERIKKSLYTIKGIRAIIKAMTTTETALDLGLEKMTPESLYGYNANFNKMYAKKGIATQLGILTSEDVLMLEQELDILENKLGHIKLLYENNEGGLIPEQNKIKEALTKALYKRMTDTSDKLSLVNLSFDDKKLITEEDLEATENMSLEEKIDYIEHIAREKFVQIVNENNGNIEEVLNKIYEPFKSSSLVVSKIGNILDNFDSILTESMIDLGDKE